VSPFLFLVIYMIMSDKVLRHKALSAFKKGKRKKTKTKGKERVVFMNVFVHVPIC